MVRLSGPYRIYVLTTDENQFRRALGQAPPSDQEKMVRIRGAVALREQEVSAKDEIWVLGFPDENTEVMYDALVRWGKWGCWQVLDKRQCRVCETSRDPWHFRRPMREGIPEPRLWMCRDCEAAAQRERNAARKVEHFHQDEEANGDDLYTQELAKYLARRKEGKTRYI